MDETYNPRLIVKDGPIIAPRVWHHVIKVLTSIAIYAGVTSVLHFSPLLSAIIAGPLLIVGIQIREHFWPTDPGSKTRALSAKLTDVVTDTSLASSVFTLALCADGQYLFALVLAIILFITYRLFRHGSRP